MMAAALLLFVLADALVFRVLSPWQFIGTHFQLENYNRHLLSDQLVLEALEKDPGGQPNVVLLGTSRMMHAWDPATLPQEQLPAARVLSLAHPAMYPPDIFTAVSRLPQGSTQLVVLGISETDTHAPLKIGPTTPFPSSASYLDTAQHLGLSWLFDQREGFYRTLVGELLLSYRYRDLFGDAGMNELRKFRGTRARRDERAIEEQVASLQLPPALRDSSRYGMEISGVEILRLTPVKAGVHVPVKMAFFRAAVERLTEEGVPVAIVELPLNPMAQGLYDGGLRDEFLQFCRELERDFAVVVVPLEQQAPYVIEDFRDLTHLRGEGIRRSTAVIAEVIERVLEPGPAPAGLP